VVDYADEFTKSRFNDKERTFAMIKPNALNNSGHII